MTLAVAACHCGCQHPSADPARRERHRLAHEEFAAIVAERPDWHGFTPPTPRDIVRYHAGEWSVPTTCPRLEHVGSIPHPAHT